MNRASTALAAGLLLVCGLIVAWPIVAGGWLTYLDNPAHLAEIHSLAFDDGGGWSDIAWCGYPLGRLHSPVWFDGLAHLVRAGLEMGPIYGFLVVLGFLTPPLVLFGMARGRVGCVAAVLLAWLLMMQKTSLVGFSSPLGGMWTFYLSCGAFLLLVSRLARRTDRVADLFWIAALYGFLGITHLFTIVPAVMIFAIHAVNRVARGESHRFLVAQGLAAALGAVASASYWAPLLLAGDGVAVISYNLFPFKLLGRLLWGAPVAEQNPAGVLGFGLSLGLLLPQVLLVGGGIAGFFLDGNNSARSRSRLTVYGFTLAVVVFVLLLVLGLFQMAGRDISWFGHVSWRLLYFVRLGMALASLPLFTWLAKKFSPWRGPSLQRVVTALSAVLLIVYSVGLGAPLRAMTLASEGPEMQEIRQLWSWLEKNHTPDWGRVYVQDPFGGDDALGNSHILALTRRYSGIDQVGPLYAGSPFPTVPWLIAESRKLFGSPMRNADHFARMLRLVPAANTTRLVLFWPDLAAEMVKKNYATYEYKTDNYAVLALTDYPQSRWAEPLDGGVTVVAERVKTGWWRLKTDVTGTTGAALLKVAWSPHWQIVQGEGPLLEQHETGLIRLAQLPAGRHVVMLKYQQSRWPDWASIIGWGLWLILLATWRLVPACRTRLAALERKSR